MDQPRRDVKGLARAQRHFASIAVIFDRQLELSGDNVQRLFFHFVILQAEALAPRDVQDLADVTSRLGENQLITPRLRHPLDLLVAEKVLVAHSALLTASGKRMATLSMMNSSISCAVRFSSAVSAMRLQSR